MRAKKLKLHLARIIMETEMENKYHEKNKLKNEIVAVSNQLKGFLGLFLHNTLVHKIELVVKILLKLISFQHQLKF